MAALQMVLPAIAPFFVRRGARRRCTHCLHVYPLNDTHWHRDKHKPMGFTVACLHCRNTINRKRTAPTDDHDVEPQLDLHQEALRRMSLVTAAALAGEPLPLFQPLTRSRPPVLALVHPQPYYCPACDSTSASSQAHRETTCRAEVLRADLTESVVDLDVEHDIGKGRALYRGRVDFDLLEGKDAAGSDDAVHVERLVVKVWIPVRHEPSIAAFVRLARRVMERGRR